MALISLIVKTFSLPFLGHRKAARHLFDEPDAAKTQGRPVRVDGDRPHRLEAHFTKKGPAVVAVELAF